MCAAPWVLDDVVPVNLNYRYVEGELRHLFADAGLVAIVLHAAFAGRVAAVAGDIADLQTFSSWPTEAMPAPWTGTRSPTSGTSPMASAKPSAACARRPKRSETRLISGRRRRPCRGAT